MEAEFLFEKKQMETNEERLKHSLKFSRDANANLKNDYDLLQEKLDKNMKATNNINQELKEEVETLLQKVSKLQLAVDDVDETIKGKEDAIKKEWMETMEKTKDEIKNLTEEKDKYQGLYKELQIDYAEKMNKMKIIEVELQALE